MNKTCTKCKDPLSYNDKWDAFYCHKCNTWAEGTCNDTQCPFECYKRPKKPNPRSPR